VKSFLGWILAARFFAVLACLAAPAQGHPIDSASLSLTEVSPGHFAVRFQSGSRALQARLEAPAVFPKACRLSGAALDCGSTGLVGRVEFPWLEGTSTRLMVDIEWQNGRHLLRVATASSPSLAVYGVPDSSFSLSGLRALMPVLSDYASLGVEHIVTGFDHLFFVIALAFLVRARGRLIATITAFTLAHSLTLACTALGLIEVPTEPVEAVIALSIVLVCAECLQPRATFTRRAPWLVAFTFGLLHGFGFASALLEIGLPERHVPAALLSFNLGVELGQLLVLLALFSLRTLLSATSAPAVQRKYVLWAERGAVYVMGGVAAFWSIERTLAALGG
jgi:hydrogenase/urease accessory protein HupE